MKEGGDIETMFSRFQILEFGIQVLNKSYTISNHVKKILRSLPVRYRPKVTTNNEAIYLNTLSYVGNLQSHEIELNGDDPVKKSKSMDLKSVVEKSGDKSVRSLKV